ncbi:YdcF family protein [Aquipuribacter sp. MA13-6]|uniref:YdcF family protein n=1 Tax=unclassified Aquipuribacter TaxID=2635084 RepID=UPI003EEDC884
MTRRAPRRRRASRAVGTLLVLALLVVLAVPAVVALRVVQVAGRDERVPADAVVVLGAAQLDGEPAPVLQARLQQALELYQDGLAPVVVTTGGGQEGDRTTEAEAGRAWLLDRGVPEDAVVAVAEGGDTYDSLVPVAAMARERGWDGVLLVSDPWHVYRVRTMADTLALPVVGASPTRTGPSTGDDARQVSYVVRETGGVLVHQARVALDRLRGLGS